MEFLKSRFVIFVGGVFLVVAVVFVGRQLYKRYQIQQEIIGLQDEIAVLEKKGVELEELIDYFEAPEFRERQARLILNLQKPGEFAVALPIAEEEQVLEEGEEIQVTSNFEKWWEYFFVHE